jgi:hypothetical protein
VSTPTQAESNAAAKAAMTAIVTAANARWESDATNAIAAAVAQGKFEVGLVITKHVSIHDIVMYFNGLGYAVFVPPISHEFNAYYFGGGWYGLWTNVYYDGFNWWNEWWNCRNFCSCKQPCTVVISWR